MKTANIYKLCNDVDTKEYVGHTFNELRERMWRHKNTAKTGRPGLSNDHIRKIGFEHFKIQLLESIPECSVELARSRESYWISQLKSELNKHNVPGRSKEQWYIDNAERVRKHHQDNYYKNRDERLKRNHEIYKTNKDTIRAQQKKYYQENKEKISERDSVKTKCECGSVIRKCQKRVHIKTEKHKRLIANTPHKSPDTPPVKNTGELPDFGFSDALSSSISFFNA